MQFSDAEWEKMRAVYETTWAKTQSAISTVHALIANFNLGIGDAKDVFERLHDRKNYPQRQKEIERMWDIAEKMCAEDEKTEVNHAHRRENL